MREHSSLRPAAAPRTRKEEYEAEYAEAKSQGEPFFPFSIFKDAAMGALVVAVLVAMTLILGVESEPMADPTTTSYNPRPEWYFLFLFEFLKYWPGSLEWVAIAVVPPLGILVLLLLPFLDRGKERNPLRRPLITGVAVIVLIFIAVLTYRGFTAPLVNPPSVESPAIAQGIRVFREANCTYCHSINGQGGAIGPDLSLIGSRTDKDTLLQYFKDPHAMVPDTLHPKLQFTSDEMEGLSSYLLTLGAPVEYSEEAPKLFQANCLACHSIDGSGGTPGPDLSKVGTFRSQQYIAAFIANPKSLIPGSTMPAFEKTLNVEQIDDVAAYLYSQKGAATPEPRSSPTPSGTPTPPPTPRVGPVSYSKEVLPIMKERCLSCHGAAVLGGLNLSDHNSTMTTGNHAPVVVPGNPNQSILYQSLLGKAKDVPQMPPGPPLPSGQIETIGAWISEGAADN